MKSSRSYFRLVTNISKKLLIPIFLTVPWISMGAEQQRVSYRADSEIIGEDLPFLLRIMDDAVGLRGRVGSTFLLLESYPEELWVLQMDQFPVDVKTSVDEFIPPLPCNIQKIPESGKIEKYSCNFVAGSIQGTREILLYRQSCMIYAVQLSRRRDSKFTLESIKLNPAFIDPDCEFHLKMDTLQDSSSPQ